jgi:hypothetical protein
MVRCDTIGCCVRPCGRKHAFPPTFRALWAGTYLREHAHLADMFEKLDSKPGNTSLVEAAASVYAKAHSDEGFHKSSTGIALSTNMTCLTLGPELQLLTNNNSTPALR